jgi:uncharacterized membrane protein
MVDRKRHLAKAVTYRVFGSATTAAIAYLITGNTGLSATVGVVDSLLKIGLYYVHERVWYRVRWGVHADAGRRGSQAAPMQANHESAPAEVKVVATTMPAKREVMATG